MNHVVTLGGRPSSTLSSALHVRPVREWQKLSRAQRRELIKAEGEFLLAQTTAENAAKQLGSNDNISPEPTEAQDNVRALEGTTESTSALFEDAMAAGKKVFELAYKALGILPQAKGTPRLVDDETECPRMSAFEDFARLRHSKALNDVVSFYRLNVILRIASEEAKEQTAALSER